MSYLPDNEIPLCPGDRGHEERPSCQRGQGGQHLLYTHVQQETVPDLGLNRYLISYDLSVQGNLYVTTCIYLDSIILAIAIKLCPNNIYKSLYLY